MSEYGRFIPLLFLVAAVYLIYRKALAEKRAYAKTACRCWHSPNQHYHLTGKCYKCRCEAFEARM